MILSVGSGNLPLRALDGTSDSMLEARREDAPPNPNRESRPGGLSEVHNFCSAAWAIFRYFGTWNPHTQPLKDRQIGCSFPNFVTVPVPMIFCHEH